jgi:hypothetical protein
MITCVVDYVIESAKIDAFEKRYDRSFMRPLSPAGA